PLLEISVSDPNLQSITANTRKEFNRVQDRKRGERLEAQIKQIESTEKAKGSDALLKAYETLLTEDPPENIAARVREKVMQLRAARAEALALMAQARAFKELGDLEMARSTYDRARQRLEGSTVTAEVDKAMAELSDTITASQA